MLFDCVFVFWVKEGGMGMWRIRIFTGWPWVFWEKCVCVCVCGVAGASSKTKISRQSANHDG